MHQAGGPLFGKDKDEEVIQLIQDLQGEAPEEALSMERVLLIPYGWLSKRPPEPCSAQKHQTATAKILVM